MWIVMSGLLMIYLHLRSRRILTLRQYLIFGFISSYLLDIHVPVIFYSIVVAAWALIDFLRQHIDFRLVTAYTIGAALGLAAWAALWLLPDPLFNLAPVNSGPLSTTTPDSIQRPWLPFDHLMNGYSGLVITLLIPHGPDVLKQP
jgi:hypothetical protein